MTLAQNVVLVTDDRTGPCAMRLTWRSPWTARLPNEAVTNAAVEGGAPGSGDLTSRVTSRFAAMTPGRS